ncbi:MAG: LysR substrate-binding domain-containing protein [Polyangiales bacterium]
MLFGLRFAVAEGDWLRTRIPDAPVALRTDSVSTAVSAVRAGAGLGLLPDVLAHGLTRVDLGAASPSRGVWIAMHPTSARLSHVKAVARFLAEAFAAPAATSR